MIQRSPLGLFCDSGPSPVLGRNIKAPEVDLLKVVALAVRDGDVVRVDGVLGLAVQGAPHPRHLGSWLEVRLLLGNPSSCFEV